MDSIPIFHDVAYYSGIGILILAFLVLAWKSTYIHNSRPVTLIIVERDVFRTAMRMTGGMSENVQVLDEQNAGNIEFTISEQLEEDDHLSGEDDDDLVDRDALSDDHPADGSNESTDVTTLTSEETFSVLIDTGIPPAGDILDGTGGEVDTQDGVEHISAAVSDALDEASAAVSEAVAQVTGTISAAAVEDSATFCDALEDGSVAVNETVEEPSTTVSHAAEEAIAGTSDETEQQTTENSLSKNCPEQLHVTKPGTSHEATVTSDGKDTIKITLKFLDERLLHVQASKKQNIGDFAQTHFSQEISEHRKVKFIFKGRLLKHDQTVEENGLHDNCVVHCHVSQPAAPPPPPPPPRHTAPPAPTWRPLRWWRALLRALDPADEEDGLDISATFGICLFGTILVLWIVRLLFPNVFSGFSSSMLVGLTLVVMWPTYGAYPSALLSFTLDRETMRSLGVERVLVLDSAEHLASAVRGVTAGTGAGSLGSGAQRANTTSNVASSSGDGDGTSDRVTSNLEVGTGNGTESLLSDAGEVGVRARTTQAAEQATDIDNSSGPNENGNVNASGGSRRLVDLD